MPITIDWGTLVISVPQSYLTFISGTLYEMDTDQFRLDVSALLAGVGNNSAPGMAHPDAYQHNTTYTVAGVTYARSIEIINGYTVTFEDGVYAVSLVGSNNNIFDEGIINRNQVSIISNNSAGLVVIEAAVGPSAIAAAVWSEDLTTYSTDDEAGNVLYSAWNLVQALLGLKG